MLESGGRGQKPIAQLLFMQLSHLLNDYIPPRQAIEALGRSFRPMLKILNETGKFKERNQYNLINTFEQIKSLKRVDCQHPHLF